MQFTVRVQTCCGFTLAADQTSLCITLRQVGDMTEVTMSLFHRLAQITIVHCHVLSVDFRTILIWCFFFPTASVAVFHRMFQIHFAAVTISVVCVCGIAVQSRTRRKAYIMLVLAWDHRPETTETVGPYNSLNYEFGCSKT